MPYLTRRRMLTLSAAKFTALAALPATAQENTEAAGGVRRNLSGFRAIRWQDHFDTLQSGAIVCDTQSKALHFWSADGGVKRTYPCSVPRTDEFARRGRTKITLKRRNPTWIPTPNMRARDPELPERIGPGPDNPMGTRALNLTWQYYRIHGIDDPDKIGRRASSGCYGLYNHHVEELFEMVSVGTQVVVL